METRSIGIILNGVTGRMGTNQHLVRSILAIREQGGIGRQSFPPPHAGTDPHRPQPRKLKNLADQHNLNDGPPTSTPLSPTPKTKSSSTPPTRFTAPTFVEMAVKAGKAIYCEKPTATTTSEALHLAQICADADLKNGVVQDKLWLPGIRKLTFR